MCSLSLSLSLFLSLSVCLHVFRRASAPYPITARSPSQVLLPRVASTLHPTPTPLTPQPLNPVDRHHHCYCCCQVRRGSFAPEACQRGNSAMLCRRRRRPPPSCRTRSSAWALRLSILHPGCGESGECTRTSQNQRLKSLRSFYDHTYTQRHTHVRALHAHTHTYENVGCGGSIVGAKHLSLPHSDFCSRFLSGAEAGIVASFPRGHNGYVFLQKRQGSGGTHVEYEGAQHGERSEARRGVSQRTLVHRPLSHVRISIHKHMRTNTDTDTHTRAHVYTCTRAHEHTSTRTQSTYAQMRTHWVIPVLSLTLLQPHVPEGHASVSLRRHSEPVSRPSAHARVHALSHTLSLSLTHTHSGSLS